jgi:acetyl esterase
VAQHGKEINVDGSRLAVVGNSVGGNRATVVALKAALENGPKIRFQVLFWPVTNARFDTNSYTAFEEGYFLTRNMIKWFWASYTKDENKRNEIYAFPLRATLEQLKHMPPALVQTAELDVLRNEGEAYARKLDAAGVKVIALRGNGLIHDYGLLNLLTEVTEIQALLRQVGMEIKRHLQ